mmetsp:Transcript_15902/g.23393  ORF Transcript_15902/g.23393 Transcript_15902/m.23393 type:complete len:290 (-) Transcript_15902:139-1008(-)
MFSIIPTCNDVLCGRSAVAFQHPGNKKLREKIANTLDSYTRCQSRHGRTGIIRDTIRSVLVDEGGRFLKQGKDGYWYDGGMKAAKSRVSTAFRDARVPNKVKCMEVLKKKQSKIRSSNNVAAANQVLSTGFRDAPVPNKVKCMEALEHKKSNRSSNNDIITATNQVFRLSSATRRSSLGSLSSAIIQIFGGCPDDNHEQQHQPRRESMSSVSSAIVQLFRGDDKNHHEHHQSRRESMNSFSTFGSYVVMPPSSTEEEESLNSSISTLDSCLLTGLIMPCQPSPVLTATV